MNKRVGVVGIDLRRLKGEFGSQALSFSGNNFGNMLFTNAVYNQIPNCEHIGFNLVPKLIKEKFDHIVIPASNWINKKEDWGFLADSLEQIDLPICLVGLGAQLENIDQVHEVPGGTLKFLRVVSERSVSIGVRGEFTKSVLSKLGFNDTVAIGCPSIFSRNEVPKIRPLPVKQSLRIGVGPTRYSLPRGDQLKNDDRQRKLYQYAIQRASSIYFQSEAFEIALLNREDVNSQINFSLDYYGLRDRDELENKLMLKGKYHKDLDQWIADVKKDDIYIGTRIHGAIAAILAGTPAILLTHDNRTKELADIMGIPSFVLEDFDFSRLDDVEFLYKSFDFSNVINCCYENIKKFKKFYYDNGLVDFNFRQNI